MIIINIVLFYLAPSCVVLLDVYKEMQLENRDMKALGGKQSIAVKYRHQP